MVQAYERLPALYQPLLSMMTLLSKMMDVLEASRRRQRDASATPKSRFRFGDGIELEAQEREICQKTFFYSSFRAGSHDKILVASGYIFCHMFNSKKILLTS